MWKIWDFYFLNDTTNVENMGFMFFSCTSLKSLDISNFVTTNVANFESMFWGCTGFRYLDLSHFLTPNVRNAKTMFEGSNGLFYLNLYNFIFNSVDYTNIFNNLKPYTIYCINDEPTKNEICPDSRFCFCHPDCAILEFFKIDFYNKISLDSCEKSNNKFDYKDLCYPKCPSNTLMLGKTCID